MRKETAVPRVTWVTSDLVVSLVNPEKMDSPVLKVLWVRWVL